MTAHGAGGLEPMVRVAAAVGLYFALIFALPLAGAWLGGEPVDAFFEFPPTPRLTTDPAPVFWPLFIATLGLIAMTVAPFVMRVARTDPPPTAARTGPFPVFGWAGLALTAAVWTLAWNRFDWFEPLQRFTFSPLWIGYILVINALCVRRSGSCPMTRHPGRFLGLFPLSAVFWWSFEYLNRIVGNWRYHGVGELSAARYFLEATLPFATVLPAVFSTAALLATFPSLYGGLDRFGRVTGAVAQSIGWIGLVGGIVGLFLVGLFPKQLFPVVWLAPLFLFSGIAAVSEFRTPVWSACITGDWRRLWLFALAGLICGLFWELWNYGGLARWSYRIPYVDVFRLFEMPILGYSGYLPFGILCGTFAELLMPTGTVGKNPVSRYRKRL